MSEPQPISEHLVERMAGLARASGFNVDLDAAEVEPEVEIESLVDARERRWSARCPDRFVAATTADLDDVLRPQIDAWVAVGTPANLVLLGDVGTGKTHAALAAARKRWVDHGDDVLFRPVVELLDELRPGGDERALAAAIDVDVLVLDDLGAERPTDWTAERLFAVVNWRWMERRPIIGTSNLAPSALREALGDRTYSRLVGDDAVVLGVGGTDRRLDR